jgi:predicted dehydrogenase
MSAEQVGKPGPSASHTDDEVTGGSPLGLAIVGLGVMGRVHAENAAGSLDLGRLVHVVDPREASAAEVASEYSVRWSPSVEDALEDEAIDAVIIASPPSTHVDVSAAAIAAGKHLLCEKPISYDLDAARTMVGDATSAGVKFQVGFHRRYDSDYLEAKRLVDEGFIGQPYIFRDTMRDKTAPPEAVIRDEQLLHDMTSHNLDCARWMFGEIRSVSAIGTQLGSEVYGEIGEVDNLIISLEFANGAIGTIDNSRAVAYGFDCRTELVGSGGTLRLDAPRRHRLEVLDQSGAVFDYTGDFLDRFRPAYLAELNDFCNVIRSGSPVRVSGEDGLSTMALAEAAHDALSTGEKVTLPR